LPRSGKPLIYSQQDRARLIAKACTRPPETPEGAQQERWTYEQLGEAVGMSGSQAHTILSRAQIKPHLTDYWIMSDFSQPEFEERLGEICGLYVDPPENVLVVSCLLGRPMKVKGLAVNLGTYFGHRIGRG
jgi:hypothetical protein